MYGRFRRWQRDGTGFPTPSGGEVRTAAGAAPTPATGRIDSQTVKATHRGGPKGSEGGKKVGGRKRFVMVGSLGRIWALMVRPADVQDRDGGRWLVEMIRGKWATLRDVIVDWGFSTKFGDRVTTRCGWTVTTTRGRTGRFVIHPRRWVVERTFGWRVRYRRRTADREYEIGVRTCSGRL